MNSGPLHDRPEAHVRAAEGKAAPLDRTQTEKAEFLSGRLSERFLGILRIRRERSPEFDPLGQGQLSRVVDGVGGSAHVGLPRVRTGLPAAAGVLLAAERAADLGA